MRNLKSPDNRAESDVSSPELSVEEYRGTLYSLLPRYIADELVAQKEVLPKVFRHATILFADVVGFSRLAFHLDPVTLIRRLNHYVTLYDRVMDDFEIEKIKTIGDAYMCVSGIPHKKPTHSVDCCLAALRIQHLLKEERGEQNSPEHELDLNNWSVRVGIHSGPCIAGVIGSKKQTFDIWGDSVNIASRMQRASEAELINISESTYNEVKPFFDCTYRGSQDVKNIGTVRMYFLNRLKAEFSEDADGLLPNRELCRAYCDTYLICREATFLNVLPRFIREYVLDGETLGEEGLQMTHQERRVYPRVESEWKLFLETKSGETEEIGYVQNISLSGVSLKLARAHAVQTEQHRLMIRLRNPRLNPPEELIRGLKEWEFRTKDEAFVGISPEKLTPQARRNVVRFLSRSDRLQVEAFLVKSSEE